MTEEYISKSGLKERGWTNKAIVDFLGEADAVRKNPYYRSAAPMLCWETTRVEKAEQTDGFIEWYNKTQSSRKKQQARQLEINSIKRKALIDSSSEQFSQEIDLALARFESIEDAELQRRAILHWKRNKEAFLIEREDFESLPVEIPDVLDLDQETISRWIENYIRHRLTNYDYILSEMVGKVGREEAYESLKSLFDKKVFEWMRKRKNQKQS